MKNVKEIAPPVAKNAFQADPAIAAKEAAEAAIESLLMSLPCDSFNEGDLEGQIQELVQNYLEGQNAL